MSIGSGELDGLARLSGPFLTAVAVFLVAWFSIVALTGWLAGRRNRESGLWAAFALFTGPIALGALLLLPRPSKKPAMSPLWAQLEEAGDARATTEDAQTLSGSETNT